jgi:hypothetical protein
MLNLIAFFKYLLIRFIFQMRLVYWRLHIQYRINLSLSNGSMHLFYVSTKNLFLSSTTRISISSCNSEYPLNADVIGIHLRSSFESSFRFFCKELFVSLLMPALLFTEMTLGNDFVSDQQFYPKLHPFLFLIFLCHWFPDLSMRSVLGLLLAKS